MKLDKSLVEKVEKQNTMCVHPSSYKTFKNGHSGEQVYSTLRSKWNNFAKRENKKSTIVSSETQNIKKRPVIFYR